MFRFICLFSLLLVSCSKDANIIMNEEVDFVLDKCYEGNVLNLDKAKDLIINNPHRLKMCRPLREDVSIGEAICGHILVDARTTEEQGDDLRRWMSKNYVELGIDKKTVEEWEEFIRNKEAQ